MSASAMVDPRGVQRFEIGAEVIDRVLQATLSRPEVGARARHALHRGVDVAQRAARELLLSRCRDR